MDQIRMSFLVFLDFPSAQTAVACKVTSLQRISLVCQQAKRTMRVFAAAAVLAVLCEPVLSGSRRRRPMMMGSSCMFSSKMGNKSCMKMKIIMMKYKPLKGVTDTNAMPSFSPMLQLTESPSTSTSTFTSNPSSIVPSLSCVPTTGDCVTSDAQFVLALEQADNGEDISLCSTAENNLIATSPWQVPQDELTNCCLTPPCPVAALPGSSNNNAPLH